jgi:hypothetical protein
MELCLDNLLLLKIYQDLSLAGKNQSLLVDMLLEINIKQLILLLKNLESFKSFSEEMMVLNKKWMFINFKALAV